MTDQAETEGGEDEEEEGEEEEEEEEEEEGDTHTHTVISNESLNLLLASKFEEQCDLAEVNGVVPFDSE